MVWKPNGRSNLQTAYSPLRRHIYDWNTVDCEIKQNIIKTKLLQ